MIRLNPKQTFNFLPVPTDIHFGSGVIQSLPERIRSMGAKRVFLITDPGIISSEILGKITGLLTAEKIECEVFGGVKSDSGSKSISEAAEQLHRSGADAVIGVGGGSSLDTAKAVAVMATNPGSILDYTGLHRVRNRSLPMIAIPTTAGTGSEVSLWSVFTNDDTGLKVAVGSVYAYPTIALCDPELTVGLPSDLTASTGMDALAHAIECYTNNACQPISASLALGAIRLIACNLRMAVRQGQDLDARYAMLLGSTMAGIAMNSTRLGLAHALAMPLGSWDLHIPHSIIIAVTLQPVMRFNHGAHPERFASVARALDESLDGLSDLCAAERAVIAVETLARDIGIPKGLADYGLRRDHIPRVIEEAMKSGNVVVNPRPTSKEELAEILEKSI